MFYLGKSVEYLISGIIVIAIVAVVVSRNSTTPGVLQSFGSAMTNILAAIVSPITSGSANAAQTNSAQNAGAVAASVASSAVGSTSDPLASVTAATGTSAPQGVTAATTNQTETDPHGTTH